MQSSARLSAIDRFFDAAIMLALSPAPHDSVLVIGTGPERLVDRIAKQLDVQAGGDVTSVEEFPGGGETGEGKTFPDAHFDAIISSFSFDYLSLARKKDALRESYRMVKPGGKLISANMAIGKSPLASVAKGCCRYLFGMKHLNHNSGNIIPELMVGCGFTPPWIIAHYWGLVSIYSAEKSAAAAY